MADKNGWRNILLKTIRETPNKKKEGSFYGMWVIMRVKPDNTVFNVTVRAGESYLMNNERQWPKDGFTDWDFSALREKSKELIPPIKACSCGSTREASVFDEIRPLLDRRNPPPVPAADAPVPPPADEIEEPPF